MHTSSNPFAYRRPITLDTLDQLFSHHRGLTGGWSMEDTGGDGGAGGDNGQGGGSGDGGQGGGSSYTPPATQADLDRIIGARLAREREQYADYAELKRKAAEHDAAVEAAKTEAEKAIDAARKEGETAATTAANARIVRAEAKAAAATAKFRDPEVAVRLLDLADVSVGDDGNVDAAALKTKLDALAAAHPYLVDDGKTVTKVRPDPSQGGGGGGDEKPGSIAEARRRAREEREAKRPKTA